MDKSEIAGAFVRLGFTNVKDISAPFFKKRKLNFGFSFTDKVDDREVMLIAGFDKNFPLSMPSYFIKDYDSFDFIPHVERDGKICYTHDDYVYLNADEPDNIIKETLDLARITVLKGLQKTNFVDFLNEFEAYWGRIDKSELLPANIIIPKEPSLIKIGYAENTRFAVSDIEGCQNQIHRFTDTKDKGVTLQNAVLIPFSTDEGFTPPRYHELVSISYLRAILNQLNTKNKKLLDRISAGLRNKEQYVLFSFNQPNGNSSLFGVKFSDYTSSGFPLTSGDFQGKITAIDLHRLDKDYLYKRGGTGKAAFEKKGIIIGAGSVGGFICEELVRNGFFNLTVVDGDLLSSDNCYRHLAGYRYIGQNKAEALKNKIEQYFPHSEIIAIPDSIENILAKNNIDFKKYDFIVVATGNVTVNVHLNKIFNAKYLGIPVIYSWNDPYGIGGHCLITNIEKAGCYNCLYANEEFYNTASFADRNQPKSFLKTISGCGSIYTPYGSIDSMQTCLITVKKIIDLMTRPEPNSIYSWKGNAELFLQEGYKLSPRFRMTADQLFERKHSFNNEKCKVCRKTP